MTAKKATAFRLTDEALALLKRMAQKSGITQAAVLELAIREKAKREAVTSDG